MLQKSNQVELGQLSITDNQLDIVIKAADKLDTICRTEHHSYYVYSQNIIAARLSEIRRYFPQEILLRYAVKANPMPELVRYISGLVDGLDVASGGELALAAAELPKGKTISFAGPGKSASEIEAAIQQRAILNVESVRELDLATELSQKLGLDCDISLRINPDFELKRAGMAMSGGSKPFGIDAERIPGLLARISSLTVNFHGFHIYSGSQCLDTAAICKAQKMSVELAIELAEHAPGPVEEVNIGGGFGIPYFAGEQAIDLARIGENLAVLKNMLERQLPGATLVLELGRYLVGEAGVYVCEVVDKKISRGKTFLVTNGGLHHHLAATGNFGQVIRKNYPIVLGNRIAGEIMEIVDIVGPLCTPLDVLGRDVLLPKAEIGDLVCILQSGAYGYSASPHLFLSHPPPQEVLL